MQPGDVQGEKVSTGVVEQREAPSSLPGVLNSCANAILAGEALELAEILALFFVAWRVMTVEP